VGFKNCDIESDFKFENYEGLQTRELVAELHRFFPDEEQPRAGRGRGCRRTSSAGEGSTSGGGLEGCGQGSSLVVKGRNKSLRWPFWTTFAPDKKIKGTGLLRF
jgi:hypothetical protein